ncbi:MAG: vitamin B12 dependent-methionine synthase activation domain-containing protein [Muribaculaceae bacterium]|nr:vitamin B12 dependent-methionine synthase activation domain-containing protein [Muribaculaceae bacterium]
MNAIRRISFESLAISSSDVLKLMGYVKQSPDAFVSDLVDELLLCAATIVKPSYYFTISDGDISATQLSINKVQFDLNSTIATLLRNSELFALFVATAGVEYQEYHNELSKAGDTLMLYVWDVIGSFIAESCGDKMELELENEIADTAHTNRFSPGYCGWNIKEQSQLFRLLPNGVCGIKVNESSLMYPIKSISGVIGIGEGVDTKKYGCQFCELKNCYKKRIKKLSI